MQLRFAIGSRRADGDQAAARLADRALLLVGYAAARQFEIVIWNSNGVSFL